MDDDKLKLKMGWPLPEIKQSSIPFDYILKSSFIVPAVGSLSKIWLTWLNNTRVHNLPTLEWWTKERPDDQPLITVVNHHSCFDEPLIHGVLPWSTLFTPSLMRWSLAAHDMVFTTRLTSWFFASGKCVPVVRGLGVHQRGMDFCTDRLRDGKWVNIFPEGKVNMEKKYLRLKWGVGRMIHDCWSSQYEYNKHHSNGTPSSNSDISNRLPPKLPVVLPIYHCGMDNILPNRSPYIPRLGKKVTIIIGEPIYFDSLIAKIEHEKLDRISARKIITDHIQEQLFKLRKKAEKLHENHLVS